MTEFTVNKFCGCISLRTGCFIIGWVQLILSCGIIIAQTIDILPTSKFDPRAVSGLLYGIPATFVAIRMLVGLYKGKDKYLKEYLVVMALIVFALLVSWFVSIMGPLLFKEPQDKIYSQRKTILVGLFALNTYFNIVVNSYKAQLDTPDAPNTGLDV